MFDFLDPAQAYALDVTFITTLLVLSVHLSFRAGIFSLASAGFAGVGGYTTAVLVTKHGWPTWWGIAAGTALAAALGLLFAAPILRLRGIYLALGSVALAESIIILIENLEVTNRTLGFYGIPIDVETAHLVAILAVVFLLLQLDVRSHFGRAVQAVRVDERTAAGLGINVWRVRVAAFVASAALAGLAGALEAHRTSVISPSQYGFGLLLPLFTYALIGGNQHWLGPVVACWGLTWLRRTIGFDDSHWEDIVYGVLLIVVMVVAPGGLTDPTTKRRLQRLARRGRTPAGSDPADPTGADGGMASADR